MRNPSLIIGPVRWMLLAWMWLGTPCLGQAQQMQLLLPVNSTPSCVVFSPDGQLIATGGTDGTVKIWDSSTGILLQEFATSAAYGITAVDFSPDGSRLLAAFTSSRTLGQLARYTMTMWQVATGQVLLTMPTPGDDYWSDAYFSPDGSRLFTGKRYGKSHLLDATTGAEIGPLAADGTNAVFCADGSRLATVNGNQGKVWDAHTGSLLLTLSAHTNTITSIDFSPDGKYLVTTSSDGTAHIWDAINGGILTTLERTTKTGILNKAVFSADGQRIIAITGNHLAYQWNVQTGTLLSSPAPLYVSEWCTFGNKNKYIIVNFVGSDQAFVYDVQTSNLLFKIKDFGFYNGIHAFNPNGQQLATLVSKRLDWNTKTGNIQVLNTQSGTLLVELKGHTQHLVQRVSSPDGQAVATVDIQGRLSIWSAATGTLQSFPVKPTEPVGTVGFAASGQQLAAVTGGNIPHFLLWDTQTGRLLRDVLATSRQNRRWGGANWLQINNDNSRLLTSFADDVDTVRLWNAETGQQLCAINQGNNYNTFRFSPDGQRLLAVGDSWDGDVRLYNATTGALAITIRHPRNPRLKGNYGKLVATFTADGKRILTSNNGEVKCWDAVSGQALACPAKFRALPKPQDNDQRTYAQTFSADGRWLLSYGTHATQAAAPIRLWDTANGTETVLSSPQPWLTAAFGSDGKTILTTSADSTLRVWSVATGQQLVQVPHSSIDADHSLALDPQLQHVLSWDKGETALRYQSIKAPSAAYTLLLLDDNDYLVYDRHFRYDGTPAALKLLGLTCGTESIGLNQLKDQLWVTGLAQRTARGETIEAPTIEQLNICGLTPKVETLPPDPAAPPRGGYHYRIHPRRGGLGATVLAVNGIEVRRYQPAQLHATGTDYELHVTLAELKPYFVPGQPNPVTVTAYTAENTIASRGAVQVESEVAGNQQPPNLYAVVVGVSDYKGEALDLKYAAKDAQDLGRTLGASARRLLNHDGQEHVFLYTLTTNADHDRQPEKQAIKATLDDISRRATANDIVLLFFAGHGTTAVSDKRFYFLTADASPASAVDATGSVGISTQELSEWLHPRHLKAQKRILIFDACQSGQAINDLIKMNGSEPTYLVARTDEVGQRIKAIEKLNEQSGMFVLAAASSTQQAYEMGRYAQGLLTYALLRAIKEQPDVLDDGRYLSVARWFGAADKGVQELARASGQRQQPQLVSTTNFNIGEVDEAVRGSITLPQSRPVFAASNFQNADPAILDDDLGLSLLLDQQLQQLGARGNAAPLVYTGAVGLPDAYSLLGRYTVQGDAVQVRASLRLGRRVVGQFEVSGAVGEVDKLAADISRLASERVGK